MPNDDIRREIDREVGTNPILIYGKGTKDAPRCGFTMEVIEFFNDFGYPFEVINVLENEAKRDELTRLTDWPTLPKVFIGGRFYGDTDILGPMAESGELKDVLAEAFSEEDVEPAIRLR